MSQKCLNCGAPMYQIFDPCIDCGMRPTDPSLRKGAGKAAYQREQGRHRHALSMKYRSKAAKGLREDLLKEVPMFYGLENCWTDAKLGEIHRKGMVGKNGGGLPPGVSETSHAKLPWERLLIFLLSLAIAYRIFF